MQSAGGQQASEPLQKSAKMLPFNYSCGPSSLSTAWNFNVLFKVETVESAGNTDIEYLGHLVKVVSV